MAENNDLGQRLYELMISRRKAVEEKRRNDAAKSMLHTLISIMEGKDVDFEDVHVGMTSDNYIEIAIIYEDGGRVLKFKEDLSEVGFDVNNDVLQGFLTFTPNEEVATLLNGFVDALHKAREDRIREMVIAFCKEKQGYSGCLYDLYKSFISYPEAYNSFHNGERVEASSISTNPHDLLEYLKEHGGDVSSFNIENDVYEQ